ncbi:adenosylcobinamide-GDP ribazoletransferase [Gordonia sp. ABSL1-1]|uniref:adenosylcobinamide-GDP ribazoletransferase n=1 Tax=Gordonia sp. ABSL1-1 TaxID=3053923 RepID=UPI002573427A|nr:adenosylcobinamide-GDP ribazoletransferase [Gordonia sp. ABSL1-1]MDL9937353.1 adenosylcobinamide-GDP ribazoletransferase [Gordonia sp. ABSL1-1]
MVSPIVAIRTAFAWLTVAPVGDTGSAPDRQIGGAVIAATPIVGAALGALVAAVGLGLSRTDLPSLEIGLLLVALLALATRGMHLDGLADTADGLGCYGPPARVAEVMRSGPVGPFGVVTLILILGLQGVGFATLAAESRWGELAFAVGLARVGAVIACRSAVPPAHPDGFGALVAGTQRAAIAVWLSVAVAVALGVGYTGAATGFDTRTATAAVLAVAVVGGVAWLFTRHCARRMGGINGDVLGATIEIGVAVAVVVLLLR